MRRDPDNLFWWLLMLFPLLAAILVACGAVHAQESRTYDSGIRVTVDGATLTITPIFGVATPANTLTFRAPDSGLTQGSVSIPDLGTGVRNILNNAVQLDSIYLDVDGRTMVFAADSGASARVTIPIAPWAQTGNTDPIPVTKFAHIRQVPTGGSAGQVLMQQSTGSPHWANVPGVASSSPVTTGQLVHDLGSYAGANWLPYRAMIGAPPADAEENVNADWAASSGDAEILNKPTILSQAQVKTEAQGEIVAASQGLTSASIDPADSVVISDASVTSGEKRRLWAVSSLDARVTTLAQAAGISLSTIESFAQVGTDDRVPESRLPVELEGISDEWARVGWIDDDGIYQHIGASNAGSSTPAAIVTYTYSQNAQHGVALNNVPIAIRVARERPVTNLRIIVDDGETSTSIPNTPWGQMVAHELGTPWPGSAWGTKVTSDSNYDYYEITFTHTPAGLRFVGQRYEQVVLTTDETLDAVLGKYPYDRLVDLPVNTQRELLDGALVGVAVNAINNDSGVTRTNLQDALDLDDEGHGLLSGSFTFGVTGRSNTSIGFASVASGDNSVLSESIPFQVAIENVARAPRYLASSAQYGVVLAHALVYYGATPHGTVVVRAARDANNRVGLNAQYIARSDAPTRTASFSVTISGIVAILPAGVPRGGASGTTGPAYKFPDALPPAAGYAEGDMAVVWRNAANRGLYINIATTVHVAADTQLGGKTIDPSSDLGTATAGLYSHQYFSRTAYAAARGGSIPANTTWADAPADLESVDFNYRTATRSDGQIEFRFSTTRSYTGYLRVSAGTLTLDVGRLGSTTWRLTGLSAAQIVALRENTWTITEPQSSGTTITLNWVKVAGL